jgi:hypothetical protein
MTTPQDPKQNPKRSDQMGNNASDAGTNRQQQQTQGGGKAQQPGSKEPQSPADSGSQQSLQPHSSGHDQPGKSAGRTNSNDDTGNGPHRGG